VEARADAADTKVIEIREDLDTAEQKIAQLHAEL